jgi:hypothetical protein
MGDKNMFTCMGLIAIVLFGLSGIAQGAEGRVTQRHVVIKEVLDHCTKFPAVLTKLTLEYVVPMKLHPVAFQGTVFGVKDTLESNKFHIVRSAPGGGVVVRKILAARKKHEKERTGRDRERDGYISWLYKPYEEDDDLYELIAERGKVSVSDIALFVRDREVISNASPGSMDSVAILKDIICNTQSVFSLEITNPIYKSAQEKSVLFFEPDVTFARFCLGLSHAYSLCKSVSLGCSGVQSFIEKYEGFREKYEQIAAGIVPGKSDVLLSSDMLLSSDELLED